MYCQADNVGDFCVQNASGSARSGGTSSLGFSRHMNVSIRLMHGEKCP